MIKTKAKQILYYSPTIWGNTDFYRTTGVLPFINHPELTLRDISHFGKLTQWDLQSADAIIVQRPCTPDHLELIKLAKACDLKVVIDYDDDVLNVDMFNPTYRQYKEQRLTILRCIELADEVWCSTQGVRDSLGKDIIIPNALNDYLLSECASFNANSNRIVWRGGASHEADVYEHADKIVELVNSHTELDFYFIGYRFTYLEQRCGDNYFAVEQMPLMQYFDYLRSLQPRAMIFPLCDTPLNRAKSNISWLEATWAGAAWIGNILPEFNIEGTIAMNASLNWVDVFEKAQELSVENIQQNFLLSDINKLRVKSLLEL